jgi:hypothetical protein
LKDVDRLVRWPHVDDVIVELHVEGENVWQANARATWIDGVATDAMALFLELCESGQVPMASGEIRELPILDAAGVAQICTFELECADYEADCVLLEEPSIAEPQVLAVELWPALQRNAYKTGKKPAPWGVDYTPLVRLAESTGIPRPTLQRISTNATATMGAQTAMKLLMELDGEQARELEETVLAPWLDARDELDRQGLGFEYFEGPGQVRPTGPMRHVPHPRRATGTRRHRLDLGRRAAQELPPHETVTAPHRHTGGVPHPPPTGTRTPLSSPPSTGPTLLRPRSRRRRQKITLATTRTPPRRQVHHREHGDHAHTPTSRVRTTPSEEPTQGLHGRLNDAGEHRIPCRPFRSAR